MKTQTSTPEQREQRRAFARSVDVPVNALDQPDFAAHRPNRTVTLADAESLGLSLFWDPNATGACIRGHLAPRYTTNSGFCSDCRRVKARLHPVYNVAPIFRWSTLLHQRFCEVWASTGSFTKARAAIGCPNRQHVRDELQTSPAFRELFNATAPAAAIRQLGLTPSGVPSLNNFDLA